MISMQAFRLHIVSTMECSDTKTHLLPVTRSAWIFGVMVAISSGVIKLEPPPEATSFNATQSKVYQKTANIIR